MVRLRLGLGAGTLFVLLAVFGVGFAPALQILDPVAHKQPAPATYSFAFNKASWTNVLEWLSRITKLPIAQSGLRGTFTFVPPKRGGRERQYTVPEIMDILNEALAAQKLMLIRRQAMLRIFPADEQLDPEQYPLLRIEDLANRGKTEVARVVYQPTMVPPETLAFHVKKMTGPLGQVIVSKETGHLVLVDTAPNLRAMIAALNDLEDASPGEVWAHKCKHCKATEVAEKLRGILGALQPGKAQRIAIAADEAANIVFVSGPPEKVALARATVGMLDVPHGLRNRRLGRPLDLNTYAVPGRYADAAVEMLRDLYRASPWLRFAAVGPSVILVSGPAADQKEIAPQLASCWPAPGGGVLLLVNEADAKDLAEKLTMMDGDPAHGGPSIVADPSVNGMIFKGSPQHLLDLHKLLWIQWPGAGPLLRVPAQPAYRFACREAPWSQVLGWLSGITGLRFYRQHVPSKGSFTLDPATIDGKEKQYTVAEIIDLVNEALAAQNLVLVRGQWTMGVYPADKPLDPSLLRTVAPIELAGQGLGTTEIVGVVFSLKTPNAKALVLAVKKMMGPLSQVRLLEDDQLLLIDTVASLREIIAALRSARPETSTIGE
jgi:hypothetical protein